tara:strand:+ start:174 stop:1580 length:1407 start_codon:yes stop_codon:yes gene_type:complete
MYDKRDTNLNNNIISPASILGINNILNQIDIEKKKGKYHILISDYQKIYGENLNTNIIIPYIENDSIKDLVVINNPDDVVRISNKHIKKSPILEPILYNSIISTTDVKDWKEQRKIFQEAFSVSNKLEKIIPISIERAKYCNELLITKENKDGININDFFLNETMAQLQLAMFGFSNEFQEKTNYKIRKVFDGDKSKYEKKYYIDFLEEVKKSKGPLSLSFQKTLLKKKKETFGNSIIFSFAGHDTTGNTLTWLIYELSNNLNIQNKLQIEVNLFWEIQDNKQIKYQDFKRLPYMTRCIMETLRLWSPIPNGTYRELIDDDYIIGKNNKKIKLLKGTYIQIPNWSRHRNPILWGEDVNIFNPDREFKEDELWNDSIINTYNPSSERFSPFTYTPRDCIGKNFSQIEMRIILLYLLKDYNFYLTPKQVITYKNEDMGINKFTLAPRSIFDYTKQGLYVNVTKKTIHPKL